jgi:hypothetical protein
MMKRNLKVTDDQVPFLLAASHHPHPPGQIFATTNVGPSKPPVLFATTNTQRPKTETTSTMNNIPNSSISTSVKPQVKLFTTFKGKKIFNITKEPIYKRKSVKIIYKNEDDYLQPISATQYNYDYIDEVKEENFNNIKNEEFYDNREEEYLEEDIGEEENKIEDENNDNLFGNAYPSYMSIFK